MLFRHLLMCLLLYLLFSLMSSGAALDNRFDIDKACSWVMWRFGMLDCSSILTIGVMFLSCFYDVFKHFLCASLYKLRRTSARRRALGWNPKPLLSRDWQPTSMNKTLAFSDSNFASSWLAFVFGKLHNKRSSPQPRVSSVQLNKVQDPFSGSPCRV